MSSLGKLQDILNNQRVDKPKRILNSSNMSSTFILNENSSRNNWLKVPLVNCKRNHDAKELFSSEEKYYIKQVKEIDLQEEEQKAFILNELAENLEKLNMEKVLPYIIALLQKVYRSSKLIIFDFQEGFLNFDENQTKERRRGKSIKNDTIMTTFNQSFGENSEEIRHLAANLLLALLKTVLSNKTQILIAVYFPDIICLTCCISKDKFNKAKLIGYGIFMLCANDSNIQIAMSKYCTPLAKFFKQNLIHHKSKVRIRTIQLFASLIKCAMQKQGRGGGSDAIPEIVGFRVSNNLPICAFYQGEIRTNYFGFLVNDSKLKVRREFYKLISTIFLDLENAHEYYTLMVPFFLAGYAETDKIISQTIASIVSSLNNKYESDPNNTEIVLENKQYDVINKPFCNYKMSGPCCLYSRPGYGIRMLLMPTLRKLYPSVINEINHTNFKQTNSSLKLLRSMLIFFEDSVLKEYNFIFQHLLQARLLSQLHFNTIEAASCKMHILEVANVIGRFLTPKAMVCVLEDVIMDAITSDKMRSEKLATIFLMYSEIFTSALGNNLRECFPQLINTLYNKPLLELCIFYKESIFIENLSKLICILCQRVLNLTRHDDIKNFNSVEPVPLVCNYEVNIKLYILSNVLNLDSIIQSKLFKDEFAFNKINYAKLTEKQSTFLLNNGPLISDAVREFNA